MKKLLFLTLAVGTSLMFFSSCGKTESKETELSKQGSLTSRYDTTYINDLVVIKDNEPSVENLISYNTSGITDEEALAYGRNYYINNMFNNSDNVDPIFKYDKEKYVFSIKSKNFNTEDVIIVVKKYCRLSEQQTVKKTPKTDKDVDKLTYLISDNYMYFDSYNEKLYLSQFNKYKSNTSKKMPLMISRGEIYQPEVNRLSVINLDVFFDVYYYSKKTDKIELSFKNSHFEVKTNNLEEKYKYQFSQFAITQGDNYGYIIKNKVIDKFGNDCNKINVSTPLVNRDGMLILFAGLSTTDFILRK